MKLTHGKLLTQDDWLDLQDLEYWQLDQYDAQGMFGDPVAAADNAAIFHLIWTYVIKALDRRKKAQCVCNGSSRLGSVQVLDETYANCVDQTSSRLFYAIAGAENLLVFGADISNAFAEAPQLKQGFFIWLDRAFNKWWVKHKGLPPIPISHVIPVLSAMQGHPILPWLWEKHTNAILRKLGLTPTVHEPCLYPGLIAGRCVIFKWQVDNFAVAAPDKRTLDILLDLIDDKLTIPLKKQGLINMFNGIDVLQTKDYIWLTVIPTSTNLWKIPQHLAQQNPPVKKPTCPTPYQCHLDQEIQLSNGLIQTWQLKAGGHKNADQLQSWRWWTHMGHDNLQTRHCLHKS
jgi:hypothetical protein